MLYQLSYLSARLAGQSFYRPPKTKHHNIDLGRALSIRPAISFGKGKAGYIGKPNPPGRAVPLAVVNPRANVRSAALKIDSPDRRTRRCRVLDGPCGTHYHRTSMISAEQFLTILQKKDLLPVDLIERLRQQIGQFEKPPTVDDLAAELIQQGYLTPTLANRLIQQGEPASGVHNRPAAAPEQGKADEGELELAPLDDKTKPRPAPRPPQPGRRKSRPSRARSRRPPASGPPRLYGWQKNSRCWTIR